MKTNPAYVRALYIILVPVVLLIILLNSGYLQRYMPAASVNGKTYNVVAYNYYYFDYYTSFLEENEDRLDEIGYDPNLGDNKQNYDANTSWREYFLSQAELSLSETAYYYDQAVAANYTFTEEQMLPMKKKLAEEAKIRETYGLSESNFYISYYGTGMDSSRYDKELTKQTQAKAYKQVLINEFVADEADINAYLSEHPTDSYTSANIRVITMNGLTDRATDEYGKEQQANLTLKMEELKERYANGTSFEELQKAFSTCELGDSDGLLTNVIRSDVEDGLANALFVEKKWSKAGDYDYYVSTDNNIAYFIVYDGPGVDGPKEEARKVVAEEKLNEAFATANKGNYQVKRNALGMTLASR